MYCDGDHFEKSLLITFLTASDAFSTFTTLFLPLCRGHYRPGAGKVRPKLIHLQVTSPGPCSKVPRVAVKMTVKSMYRKNQRRWNDTHAFLSAFSFNNRVTSKKRVSNERSYGMESPVDTFSAIQRGNKELLLTTAPRSRDVDRSSWGSWQVMNRPPTMTAPIALWQQR